MLTSDQLTDEVRTRGLVAWAYLYFLFSFRWWLEDPLSFSVEGLRGLQSVPLWFFDWLPRLGAEGVSVTLEFFTLLSLGGVLLAYREKSLLWSVRMLCPLLLAKLYFYALDLRMFTTFHHMHLLLVVALLVSKNKIVIVQASLFGIYIVSGLGKLNESWLSGAYFQSLSGGLPLFGDSPTWLWVLSLAVVGLELFGPWFWLASNRKLRCGALALFILFHGYSGFIVGFQYTLLMLPVLILALFPMEQPLFQGYTLQRREIPAYLVLSFSFLACLTPMLTVKDVRYTGERRYFSISNMFDANRSVEFEVSFFKQSQAYRLRVLRPLPQTGFYDAQTSVLLSQNNGPFTNLTHDWEIGGQVVLSPDLFRRCHVRIIGDPYLYIYYLRELCRRVEPDRFEATLKTRLNGESIPHTIFHLSGACSGLPDYSPWGPNEWIADEADL